MSTSLKTNKKPPLLKNIVVKRRSYEAFGKIRAMDYGTNNNSLANTTIQTTRAFTGHEQIAELSGLIHSEITK